MKFEIKGIMFDLDGTLVDSRDAYLEAASAAFAAMGRNRFRNSLVTEIPKRLEQDKPIQDLLQGIDTERFLSIYLRTYYLTTQEKSRPFPNVAETLDILAKKANLGLITRRNVPRKLVIHELEKFRLEGYFKNVITSLDTVNPKPSPEALLKCSTNLCPKIDECLVVGDSVIDVRAGKNVGAKTVGVLSGIYSKKELVIEKPDLIIRKIDELPEHVA